MPIGFSNTAQRSTVILVVGVVGLFSSVVVAAEATSSVSATIQAGGSVGTAVETPVETAVEDEAPTVTSTSIPTVPVSTTSNVGLFSDPAPVAVTSEETTAATPTSNDGGRNSGGSSDPSAPRFPSSSAVPLAIGAGSAVAVAGSPNQTYSIILPESTVFASGAEVVSLNQIQHNAGQTPSLNGQGSDVFSVGADVSTSPADDGSSSAQTGGETGVESAFSSQAPLVNIVVSYN